MLATIISSEALLFSFYLLFYASHNVLSLLKAEDNSSQFFQQNFFILPPCFRKEALILCNVEAKLSPRPSSQRQFLLSIDHNRNETNIKADPQAFILLFMTVFFLFQVYF